MKALLFVMLGVLLPVPLARAGALPQTRPLDWEEANLSARLMDGAHRFVERKIAESAANRADLWARDFSSPDAYEKSVETNRAHLKTIIGAVDARLPAAMERYGDDANPALVAETTRYRVYQVRWPALEGLWGSGLLVQPQCESVAHTVVVPDAGQTPEQWLGLAPGIPAASQAAWRLAENGFELVLPLTINRDKLVTDDGQVRISDQTHREWVYRQAFHMGRHVIGYEVQTVMGAVDWLRERHGFSMCSR